MKRLIKEKVRPALGRFARENLSWLYKIYEKIFWYMVGKRKNKGLHEKGYKYLKKIDQILTRNKIKYFVTYGTLLGLIREGKFMDYDDDIDLGVIDTDDFSWENLERSMREIGMVKSISFC